MTAALDERPPSHLRTLAAAVPVILYRGVAGGLPVLMGLFIASRWGLTEVAVYTVANAAISIALVVADGGATRALPRDLAVLDATGARRLLSAANAFRLMLILGLLVVAAAAILLGGVSADVAAYFTILLPLCLVSVFATNAASERVVSGAARGIGVAVLAGLFVFAGFGAAVLHFDLGPRLFVGAYVLGKATEAAVMVAGRTWVASVSSQNAMKTARALWPFSAQMILGVLYSRLAVFTAERMTTRVELGVFSVAAAFQGALLLVPASLALVYFPNLTRKAQAGHGVRPILIRYTIVSALGVAGGCAVLVLFSGPIGTALRVPDRYLTFVLVFSALSLFSIFSMMAGFLMQSRGMEARTARLSVVTLALALVYQVVALRAWGLWGLVVAVAAAEITTVAIFAIGLRQPRRA